MYTHPFGDLFNIIFWNLLQRQKLREILLRQQQTKNAVRHEKVLDQLQMTPGTHPTQWQQDSPHRQHEVFNRPPPPYPGNIRASLGPKGNIRFSAFSKEQRTPFPGNGQFNRPPFTGDMSIAIRPPPGHRYVYGLFFALNMKRQYVLSNPLQINLSRYFQI